MSTTVNPEIAREISLLSELADSLASSSDLNETMAFVTDTLERVVSFDSCVFYLEDKISKNVFSSHLMTQSSEKSAQDTSSAKEERAIGSGVRDTYDLKEEFETDYKSALSAPLKHGDCVLGTLTLYKKQADAYTDEHRHLLEMASSHAAKAVQNALMFEKKRDEVFSDNLTGLLNSKAFYSTLDQRIVECYCLGDFGRLTVLCIDVDNFKEINEKHGHLVGDKLLIEIANAIQGQLRSMDSLARYGGDEFVAILPLASGETSQGISERILGVIETKKLDVGLSDPLQIRISVGTASYPNDGNTSHELLATANRNMYHHKQMRKASVLSDGMNNTVPIDSFR